MTKSASSELLGTLKARLVLAPEGDDAYTVSFIVTPGRMSDHFCTTPLL